MPTYLGRNHCQTRNEKLALRVEHLSTRILLTLFLNTFSVIYMHRGRYQELFMGSTQLMEYFLHTQVIFFLCLILTITTKSITLLKIVQYCCVFLHFYYHCTIIEYVVLIFKLEHKF